MASTIWGQASPTAVTGYTTTTETNATYGLYFTVAQAGTLQAIWFYSPAGSSTLPAEVALYAYIGSTLLTSNATPSWSGSAGSGWVRAALTPVALSPSTGYVAVYFTGSGTLTSQAYLYTGSSPAGWFPSTSADGNITAPQATPANNNAPYNTGSFAFPATYNGNNLNWLLDVEVSFGGGPLYQPQQRGSRLYHKRHTRFQQMPSIPGTKTELGPLTIALPTIIASLSGHVVESGGLVIPLPTLTMSLIGTAQHTESGSLAIPLPTLTTSLNGHVVESGGLAIPLPTLTTSLSGTAQHTESGALAVPLPTLTTALAGSVVGGESGAFAPVLLKPVTSLSGTITHQGTLAVPLPTLYTSISGTAQHTESGSLSVPLPTLSAALSGKVGHVGSPTIPLPTFHASLSGTAQHTESGALAIPLPTVTTTLAGLITHKGSFAIALPTIQTVIAGSAGGSVTGSFVIILPPGQRFQLEAGSFNPVLPTLTTSISGRLTGEAGGFSLALPILRIVLTGIAQQSISGSLNLVLPISPVGGLVARVGHENGQLTIALATIQVSLTGVLVHMGVLNPNLGIGMQLTRYEMFGSESRGELTIAMPILVMDLEGGVHTDRSSQTGYQRAAQTRRQHKRLLRAARIQAMQDRPHRAGEEE